MDTIITHGWEEEKAQMMIRLGCTEEALDEMLDDWLDAAKEADHSQHDAWGEW